MQKFYTFLISFLLVFNLASSAQYFERIYSGLNISDLGSLDNTMDSGFILCGTQDGGFLMKLKANGDTEWAITDTGSMQNSAAVIQDASGHFVVIGSGPSQQWNSQAVVSTYDASGNLISDMPIPPVNALGTWGTTITRSPDRQSSHYCFYTDGYTADNYFTMDNAQVIGGDQTYVGINSISMDDHGNYYAAANLDFDMDSLFNWRNNILLLSSNHFSRTANFYDTKISSSAITSDGLVMLAGLYDSLGTKYLRLMKFDSSANLMWNCFIGDTSIYAVQQITETADGGFAILCAANDGNIQHISFFKVDAYGTVVWKQHFYGNGTAYPKNFKVLDDGYAILGITSGDPYVIRTDILGRTGSTEVPVTEDRKSAISVYPNPSNGIVNISLAETDLTVFSLSVLDLQGRVVFESNVSLPVQQIDLSFLAKGVYQFKFTAKNEELKSGKFVIE
ncbi:MAG: T9SS type A sorting domain-containing protein [Bacteroidetes bacterium]|nr:T9SS type A sorting domain-containing protein [Bacteroidota bacterium]